MATPAPEEPVQVPNFSDLGKNARDVFKTGYHYGKGLFKMVVKSKKDGVFDVTSDLAVSFDTSKLDGMLETKYRTETYGNFIQKWNTEGTGSIGCELTGKIFEGLSLMSDFFYNPQTTMKGLKLDAKYINDRFNGSCSIANDNFDTSVNLYGAVVMSFKDLAVGYQCGYKTATKELTKNDIGMAFSYRDFSFHVRCTSIPHEFGCSILYNVNTEWDVAVNGITAKSGGWHEWMVGLAAKYKLDEDSIIRFKINNSMQLGASLQQKLSENATVSLSFNIDCGNISKGTHKIGLALELEA
ncbi:hypothetical protein KPH14_005409 [Odynerus spinipes]|uniref:Voltage-dependent anion-selective channel n=1 Tax=Odynerus spinipes TaxID=1348599 RepID=A0AAD9RBL7_9HYME|nr:hypothetical protein KPH14_005409 [Odynerus spinipes]